MDQLGFVHVSDCHFGSVLANDTYSWTRQPAHDIRLCKALMNALEEARELIALGNCREDGAVEVLREFVLDPGLPWRVREQAVRAMARTWRGGGAARPGA